MEGEDVMKIGATFIGTDDADMIEFLNYIREHGGQCVCTDYGNKIIEVVRGTKNDKKGTYNFMDGVLGVVDPGDAGPGEDAE